MYFDIFHTIKRRNYHYFTFKEVILVLLIANSVQSLPLERKQQSNNAQNYDDTNKLIDNGKYYRITNEKLTQDNWQLPSKFLEKRGYIYDNLPSHEISQAAHNIINGPLLNPISSSFTYGKPISQYVHPSNAIIHTRTSNNEPEPDDAYIGHEYIDKIGQTWKKWFGGNATTTTTTSTHPPETANKTLRSVDLDFEKQWLGEGSNLDTQFSSSDIAFIKCFIGCLKSTESVVDECEKRYLTCSSENNSDSTRNDQSHNESDATVANHLRYFDKKLRFLANVHHPVDQVGQVAHTHLNLSIISNIIDNVRNGLSYQNINSATEATCTNRPESKYLLPFAEKKLTKRSDYSDESNMKLYHNDYLDANADDEDFEPNNDEESELFSRRHKHKKNRRKGKKRKKWYNFGRKQRPYNNLADDSLMDNHQESQAKDNADLSDFNDIKFRIHPSQEQDIVKFIKNVNEAPQMFDFNVDDYIAQKALDEISPTEVDTEKAFYEFIPSSNIGSPLLLQTGSDSLSNTESKFEKPKSKRDILTQRLKGIANKMVMFPNASGYYATKSKSNDESGSQIFEDKSLIENYDEQQFEDENLSNGNNNNLNSDLDIDMNLEKEFRDFDSLSNNHFYPELYNYTSGF